MVVYMVAVVVLFPCMILQVISGALYGFVYGVAVSFVATSTGPWAGPSRGSAA